MRNLEILMMLLPVIFMIHDFEEIIMFKGWLSQNREVLSSRFPKLESMMDSRGLFAFSTADFSVAVLHEFLLVSVACFVGVYFGFYGLWFAAFVGYFLHLFVHIGQWIIFRAYVPVIITSILTMPYCFYVWFRFWEMPLLSVREGILWGFVGSVVMLCSIPMAFYWVRRVRSIYR